MKLLKYLFIAYIFLITNNLSSQNLEELKSYMWEDHPDYFKYNNGEELIGVKDKTIVDFEYDEDGNLNEYYLIHNAYILNSDEKIEDYNKLYLPYTSSSSELKEIKARVIKQSGEIIVLDESKILVSKDEETGKEYKYYAFEGVEKGSVIEYYYILKRSPVYSGKKVSVQYDYVNNNYEFHLYSPISFAFKIKSYNDLYKVILDTNTTDNNHWQLNIDKVEKLEYEDQSAYKANTMFFIYKLDRTSNQYNVSSYSGIATNIYNLYYSEKTNNELKGIKKVINETGCKIARNKFSKNKSH